MLETSYPSLIQRSVTAFDNILDKTIKTQYNKNQNQYSLLWEHSVKFTGGGQRQPSKTRPWVIQKFHTHVSVLSVGCCSCLDSWGAGGGTIAPQSGLLFRKHCTFLFENFTLTVLVDQLQLGVDYVALSAALDGKITGENEPDAACHPGSWQSPPKKDPSRLFMASPAGDLWRD